MQACCPRFPYQQPGPDKHLQSGSFSYPLPRAKRRGAVPWLLISLLGFWKGSWAVSNPRYLLMAVVRLCSATLPYALLCLLGFGGCCSRCWMRWFVLPPGRALRSFCLQVGVDVVIGARCYKHVLRSCMPQASTLSMSPLQLRQSWDVGW